MPKRLKFIRKDKHLSFTLFRYHLRGYLSFQVSLYLHSFCLECVLVPRRPDRMYLLW